MQEIKPFSTEDLNVFSQMLRHAASLYSDYTEFYTQRADEIEVEYLTQIREAINAKIGQLQEESKEVPQDDYPLTASEEASLVATNE